MRTATHKDDAETKLATDFSAVAVAVTSTSTKADAFTSERAATDASFSSANAENDSESQSSRGNVEKIKDLAKAFLSEKPRKPTAGCCPPEQHKKTDDGTDTCPCPPDATPSNIPPNAPSDIGRRLAAAPAVSCLILGDSGVGKTSFLNKHMTGHFTEAHDPTTSVGVAQLLFATNKGWIKVHTIDTVGAGHPKLGGLEESYYESIQSVIFMFDVTNPKSYKNAIKRWYKEIQEIRPEIPKVLVGNKCDSKKERRVRKNKIAFHRDQENHHYFDLSVDQIINIEIPFLVLLIEITGMRDLQFVQSADLVPEEP